MKNRTWVIGLCGWLVFASASIARGEPLTVKEFQDKLQGWKAEGKAPPPLTFEVEGRVSLYFKDHLRLYGLKDPPVLFVSKSEIPDLNRKWAIVTGKVRVDPVTGEYTFDLVSAKETPSDFEKFRERKRKLFATRVTAAAAWYELGRWAESHGQFYKDDELIEGSTDVYRHGIDIERKELAKDNPEGLLELADKARSFRLPTTLAQELTHEALHLLVLRSANQSEPALKELAEQIAEKLPGALVPPDFTPHDLKQNYKTEPLATYAGANATDRRKLHRLMYIGLLLKTIVPEVPADGGKGFEYADQLDKVAEKVEKLIPDQPGLAEKFRERALTARAADPERLTKSQVLDLAEQYRRTDKPRQGDQLLEAWLEARRKRLDPDDTEGLLQLTEEYRRLLKNNDRADRLLIEGWKRNRQARDIAERLEKAGYVLVKEDWVPRESHVSQPESRLEKAIRTGLTEPGMTASQVLRSRGKPDSLSRAVSFSQVIEVWSYLQADGSFQVVRFVKRSSQSEPTVTGEVETVKKR